MLNMNVECQGIFDFSEIHPELANLPILPIYLIFCLIGHIFLPTLAKLPNLPNPGKNKNPLNVLKFKFYFILEYLNSILGTFQTHFEVLGVKSKDFSKIR